MLSHRAHEAPLQLPVVAKAALSSGAATIADGLVYQLFLFVLPQHYGVVAAAGAVAGAIVNFLINRHYTFNTTAQRAWPQPALLGLSPPPNPLPSRGEARWG